VNQIFAPYHPYPSFAFKVLNLACSHRLFLPGSDDGKVTVFIEMQRFRATTALPPQGKKPPACRKNGVISLANSLRHRVSGPSQTPRLSLDNEIPLDFQIPNGFYWRRWVIQRLFSDEAARAGYLTGAGF
jgi:hypothetical protein